MSVRFRLPYITAKTVPEQLTQIISYLRQLATQLQQLSEGETAVQTVEERARSVGFQDLYVGRELTAAGGINGVYIKSVRLQGTDRLQLKSRFAAWDDTGNRRQSFLIAGNVGRVPVLGLVYLDSAGNCTWSGTDGVKVATGEGGSVTVSFGTTGYDTCIVQSPEWFSVESGIPLFD